MSAKPPMNQHQLYHAHLYYDQQTLHHAQSLREQAGELFDIQLGRLHQKLVGPHPRWSCQLSFNSEQFDSLIPWLEEQRQGLSILVHGVTGDDLRDHTEFAYWLGEPLELKLAMFQRKKSLFGF